MSSFGTYSKPMARTHHNLRPAAASLDPASMPVKALKDLIASAGLSHADCVEKSELRARAVEALAVLLEKSASLGAAGPPGGEGGERASTKLERDRLARLAELGSQQPTASWASRLPSFERVERPPPGSTTGATTGATAGGEGGEGGDGGIAAAPAARPLPPGRLDAQLSSWGIPADVDTSPLTHEWPLAVDHAPWIDECVERFGFHDGGELLRHLVFSANVESNPRKKLIFKVIRCLHCHSGARAGSIPKTHRTMDVFAFQNEWLNSVKERCKHASVEKTVRIIFDFYRKTTSEDDDALEKLMTFRRGGETGNTGAQGGVDRTVSGKAIDAAMDAVAAVAAVGGGAGEEKSA